jgi:2-polyprenyl-6-methoxyphenol hydroxylase-like FAD-dependent oxidoreductase
MSARERVLIVGAGPTGLVSALGLAQAGADVTVVEREPDVVGSPRATVYVASTLKVLDGLGLLEDAQAAGARSYEFNQRFALTGTIAAMDHRLIGDLTPYAYALHFGQDELARIVLRHLSRFANARVLWNTAFEGLRQDPSAVSVTLTTPSGTKQLEFDWVIGTDGARSAVRPAMGVTFDGFTWPETFMATNVHYDFESLGWVPSNMVADGENWRVVARLNKTEHFWRISYGERTDLTEEQRVANIPERFKHFLPDSRAWQLDRANSYRVHQRCASTLRVGRVLLAGDAAHATNPIGGMGFTTGVQDASTLIRSFAALLSGTAGPDVLDFYAYERRRVFLQISNPTAIEFKRRAQETDTARRREDEAGFFKMMEDREAMRAALMSVFELSGRPYREDWRETFLKQDLSRGIGESTLVLGASASARITPDIE